MPRRPRKVHEERDLLEIGDLKIPLRIITETGRYYARASVTSRALIIRLPRQLSTEERRENISNMLRWARETLRKKPEAFAQFRQVARSGHYTFAIRGVDYDLSVVAHDLQHHKIIQTGKGTLEARVNTSDRRLDNGKLLPKLLAKYFGGIYLPEVSQRVNTLNDQHFQRPINTIKLSDTYSRWGSCSSKGNINLATRLLLAPNEVLDAVIIHELAHLVEANHSPRFWAQVERALPNYREYDVWLKQNGKNLSFQPKPAG
ncbi:MAG: YgjP-like metallopeptidase domain-containing protein [Bacteroidota bacterium]